MALDVTIGGTSADSFITLSEMRAYWLARNVDLSAVADAGLEANLRRAAQWITQSYNFVGLRQYQYQTLAWPRLTPHLVEGWPINPDTIPQDIKDAQAELAYLIYGGADPFATVNGGAVVRQKSKAGPVEAETEYTNVRETPRFVAIEGLLARYTVFGGSQVKMVRG